MLNVQCAQSGLQKWLPCCDRQQYQQNDGLPVFHEAITPWVNLRPSDIVSYIGQACENKCASRSVVYVKFAEGQYVEGICPRYGWAFTASLRRCAVPSTWGKHGGSGETGSSERSTMKTRLRHRFAAIGRLCPLHFRRRSKANSVKFRREDVLPRELRDAIYQHYVRVDDGYFYDFPTNSLTGSNGDRIDLSLALTCNQIANEMRGVALKNNKITFKTHFSEKSRRSAELWHLICDSIRSNKVALLNHLAPRLLTPTIVSTAATNYAAFRPILDRWASHGAIRQLHNSEEKSWGEAASVWLDFVQYVVDLLSEHPDFEREAKRFAQEFGPATGMDLAVLAHTNPRPWIIPQLDYLNELVERLQFEYKGSHFPNVKYSYSAACAAVRFLESIHDSNHPHLRHIVLLEDRESIANPWSHARGLIPYCRQNEALRIERVVNLWRTAFLVGDQQYLYITGDSWAVRTGALHNDQLQAKYISKAVCNWLSEALALEALGMPEHSFKLTLDGEPTPNNTTEVFRIVQRDAAFQAALDHCYVCGSLTAPSWVERRLHFGYIFEHLPSSIEKLQKGESGYVVRCNFPLGSSLDFESLVEERKGWSIQEWKQDWKRHEPSNFQTEPPLPSWHVLRWECEYSPSQ
ncbi:hypothetical protein BDV96DRAFT_648264 [Lophiotrema nucula]|uniref:Uncharacterized protein n=1 Tax=Lophiotrema nucula TaxID=690887 RepID=A0A6A5Z348_9PLEO|nr:hypothetical protein BDV96DRAFT_648264 [Lophiotrema nucula]